MQYLRRLIDSKYLKRIAIVLLGGVCVFLLNEFVRMYEEKEVEEKREADYELSYDVTRTDENTVWKEPKYINLSEMSDNYTIDEGGEYVISGNYAGTLTINTQDQIVHLFMDNVNINASKGAAIEVMSEGKVIITLLEDTENIIKDSPERMEENKSKAALYSESDMTINGSGKLFVYGFYEDGIRTKDRLKILGGQIYVKSKNDGIRGSDGIFLMNSEINVESEGNGIITTNIGKKNKGAIIVDDEEMSVISGKYAIVCVENLYIKKSQVYCKSVVDNLKVDGEAFVEEGCFTNE